ncbi:hypothetical protein GOP47_0019524 [Adiantum capillus-veneris]|uniref:Cyclin n=1 Tax=Adiantum capillus-veneris TaxID=13818 RepID=A0A9D4UCQ8_ADICA|nr:hypothetical protein GOP47_0019524 [Adiantum capillus-veneris]
MALRRASFGSSLAGNSFESPQASVLTNDAESRSPATSIASDNELPKILSVLSATLDYLIARNEQDFPIFKSCFSNGHIGSPVLCNGRVNSNFKLTLFHGLRAPNIGVHKYLERIYKYTNCSPSCFVVAYAYMDRLVHRHPDQPIMSLNVHRLLITSVMLAAKTLDDIHYNNAFFARVGGVSIAELNRMELDLLFRLDFRLCVTTHTFESYCLHLEQEFCHLGHRPMACGVDFRKVNRNDFTSKQLFIDASQDMACACLRIEENGWIKVT